MTFLEIQNEILTARFREGQRTECKRWINSAYSKLWAFADWPFKKAKSSVTATASTTTLSGTPISSSLWSRVISISRDDGYLLTYKTPTEFDFHFPDSTDEGTPWAYTLVDRDIILGPTPDTTSTSYSMRYELRLVHEHNGSTQTAGIMADDADVPSFDSEFHWVLIHGGLSIGLKMENDSTWQIAQDEFAEGLALMLNYYLPVQVGENRSWGGDMPGGGY